MERDNRPGISLIGVGRSGSRPRALPGGETPTTKERRIGGCLPLPSRGSGIGITLRNRKAEWKPGARPIPPRGVCGGRPSHSRGENHGPDPGPNGVSCGPAGRVMSVRVPFLWPFPAAPPLTEQVTMAGRRFRQKLEVRDRGSSSPKLNVELPEIIRKAVGLGESPGERRVYKSALETPGLRAARLKPPESAMQGDLEHFRCEGPCPADRVGFGFTVKVRDFHHGTKEVTFTASSP